MFRSHDNLPLTEQAIYDLRNSMRRGNELIDFDDDDNDYSEDEDLDIDDDNSFSDAFPSSSSSTTSNALTSSTTTTTTSTITSKRRTKTTSTVMNQVIESKTANENDAAVPSSSSRLLPELICLLVSFSSVHGSLRLTDLLFLQNGNH